MKHGNSIYKTVSMSVLLYRKFEFYVATAGSDQTADTNHYPDASVVS